MSNTAKAKLSLIPSHPSPELPVSPEPKPTRSALRRCSAAWKRSFDAFMESAPPSGFNKLYASQEAAEVYCRAMPPLYGHDGIRDFIACTAQGILIGAITPQQSGPLLYAAQVALASLGREPKSQKSGTAYVRPGTSLTF
jgi:hypothetical protein